MTDLHIQITDELGSFIAKNVAEGYYRDASAVVTAALQSLGHEEQSDKAKLQILREAIAEGDASGIARGDVIAQVKRESRLIAKRR